MDSATILQRYGAVMSLMLWLVLSGGQPALAQSESPKAEIGVHFSLLHLPRNQRGFDKTATGGGARVTFNLNANFALEGEANFYPEVHSSPLILESSAVTGFFGGKAGWRGKKVGVFGKVRPGFMHFEERFDPRVLFILPQPIPQNPHFALDFGAVVEAYASRRLVVRFDLGDTLIHFRYRGIPLVGESRFTQHNLQFNVGIGVRFF